MSAFKNKKLKKQIRLMTFEEVEENLLPFADMKDEVLHTCACRMEATQSSHKKDTNRLRITWKMMLVTASLLIGVSTFLIFAPSPVITTNGLLYDAKTWVGRALHINLNPSPTDEHGVMPDGYQEKSNWTSLQEIRDTYWVKLLEPSLDPDVWTLANTKAMNVDMNEIEVPLIGNANAVSDEDAQFFSFFYAFTNNDTYLSFSYGSEDDDGENGLFAEDVVEYLAPVGTFNTWSIEKKQYAQIFFGGRIVTIISDLSKEEFFKILDGLHTVN